MPAVAAAEDDDQQHPWLLLPGGGGEAASGSSGLQTPLYYACRENNVPLIDFLLAHGAAVDFVDKRGGLVQSPLMCAQQYGHTQLYLDLEALIGSVARPTIVKQLPREQVVLEGQSLELAVEAVAADYPIMCVCARSE
jgi:ankyrin repeat protein